MKLTPDDETSIPSREAFYGVGSSRTSLCPSPEDANVAIHVEKDGSGDAVIEKVTRKHSNDELHRIPLSGMVCDSEKTRNGMVDADHQQKCDHHDGDVDVVAVSERRIGPENAEGRDDVTKKHEERLSTDNNVDVDVDVECHDPQVKDDVVDDPKCNSILESKLTFEQQDENDDGYGDPSLSRPPTKPAPTDSPSSIQCSVYVSGDLRSTSQLPHQSRENGEPSQQSSARSLQSSRSKRQSKSSRRSSGASKRRIRSERSSSSSSSSSSSLLSKSSSGSSSASSSGSTTGSDSSSSSSCSNSDSESYSSSGSSSCSSSDSSSCSSCNESSDGESSDSEPSASGSESESSSNDEADSADVRYHISAEKNRRTSRRDSGPSSSFSFAPREYASSRTDKKLREKRWQTRHARKPSYSTITQRRRYDETDGMVHQETCSTLCVIL